jgi:hypothetical protein
MDGVKTRLRDVMRARLPCWFRGHVWGRNPWDSCECTRCGLNDQTAHDWAGCMCRRCGNRRREGHNFHDSCVCRNCGDPSPYANSHALEGGCRCIRCGVDFHEVAHEFAGAVPCRCAAKFRVHESWSDPDPCLSAASVFGNHAPLRMIGYCVPSHERYNQSWETPYISEQEKRCRQNLATHNLSEGCLCRTCGCFVHLLRMVRYVSSESPGWRSSTEMLMCLRCKLILMRRSSRSFDPRLGTR